MSLARSISIICDRIIKSSYYRALNDPTMRTPPPDRRRHSGGRLRPPVIASPSTPRPVPCRAHETAGPAPDAGTRPGSPEVPPGTPLPYTSPRTSAMSPTSRRASPRQPTRRRHHQVEPARQTRQQLLGLQRLRGRLGRGRRGRQTGQLAGKDRVGRCRRRRRQRGQA